MRRGAIRSNRCFELGSRRGKEAEIRSAETATGNPAAGNGKTAGDPAFCVSRLAGLGKGMVPAQNAGLQKRFSQKTLWLHARWTQGIPDFPIPGFISVFY